MPAMRPRTVFGSDVPAWAAPVSPLQRETPRPAVHALGRCVRWRGRLPSAQAGRTAAARERGQAVSFFGGDQLRCAVPSLRAAVQLEELADEGSTRKHDVGSNEDGRTEEPATRLGVEDQVAPGTEQTMENSGREWGATLSPTQLQQHALIRRMKTLEARRDWEGVLAAMVSAAWNSSPAVTLPRRLGLPLYLVCSVVHAVQQ